MRPPIAPCPTMPIRHWKGCVRLFAAALAVCCVFLVINQNVPRAIDGERSRVACRRLFRLSQSRMYWENPSQDSPTSCLGSGLPPKQSIPCLTRLRERRGRPAYVMFIGDSRARIIFMKIRETLKLLWRRYILHDTYQSSKNATFWERGRRLRCPHATPMFHGTKYLRWVCHLEVLSDLVRASFFWAPYVGAGYAERLAVVEEDCRSGRPCPDLIVMTLGMWYAKMAIDRPHLTRPERPLHFQADLESLVPVLRNLSIHSQLVYRVDGPDFMDGYGNKSVVNGAILTINAMATETLRKVPGLQLWSSSLAETIRFQHSVCLQLAAIHTPVLGRHRDQCLDENHVAETVRLSAAAAIVRYLCRDTEPHPAGHCCLT
ncbi:uncharacterized protein LOC122389092 [Amphibalanus amphitrite]|uniref:uncharacterized protein LOC122389092 n=1 Tax=Amphibalanus amphitrite TaxID=1232801 RepID=UPI001C91A5AE|nr:uncharacterized protein LOC122389092 [Amphibalanus amphitrite]